MRPPSFLQPRSPGFSGDTTVAMAYWSAFSGTLFVAVGMVLSLIATHLAGKRSLRIAWAPPANWLRSLPGSPLQPDGLRRVASSGESSAQA